MTMSSSDVSDANMVIDGVEIPSSSNPDRTNCQKNIDLEMFRSKGMDVTPNKDGGVTKVVMKEGNPTSRPLFGDKVYLRFIMFLENGDIIDDWTYDEQPYSFTIGQADVILAWEFGIPTMKVKEVSIFLCKPGYAFGVEGRQPHVPPNATVIFEIELLDWHGKDVSENGDGSIHLSLLENGETYGMPNEGSQCKVEMTGRHLGRIFEVRSVSFQLGEGSDSGIIPGIEQALLRFSRGEKSRLKIKSIMAYGSDGCPELGIPPGADLEYDVHLVECIRAKDFWDMSADDKLEQSRRDKEKALNYFRRGNLKQARKFFEKVVEYLQFQDLSGDCDAEQRKSILLTCHMNLALCHLVLEHPYDAHNSCTRALDLDPNNEKCLYRRSTASMRMKDFKSAVDDLRRLLELNPNNKIAYKQLDAASKRLNESLVKERSLYRGMFEKFASKTA